MSAIPASSQRSTTPPRSARSSNGLSATWTAAIGRERERLVELPAVDVRDADAPHEPVVDEPGQRAHGRAPRRPRIGRVEEVEVDRAARRAPRGSPRSRRESPSRGRPAIQPPPVALIPPFVTIARGRAPRRSARRARASSRSLWPSSVRPGPYARAVSNTVMPASSGGRDRRERALLVALGVRRQAHAAEADAQLRRVKPFRASQERERTRRTWTRPSVASRPWRAASGTRASPRPCRCARRAGRGHSARPCCGRVETERRAENGRRPLVRFALAWKAWASISRFSSRRSSSASSSSIG